MDFIIKKKDEGCTAQVINERTTGGITYFDVVMKVNAPIVPQKFSVTWKIPNINCFSIWKPKGTEMQKWFVQTGQSNGKLHVLHHGCR